MKTKQKVFMAVLSLALITMLVSLLSGTKQVSIQKTTVPVLNESQEFESGKLCGRKLADLYIYYLDLPHNKYQGNEIPVPDTLKVNFLQQLTDMWDLKVRRCPDNKVVAKTRDSVLENYNRKTLYSLEDYTLHIDSITKVLCSSIDWDKVAKLKKLSKRELQAVKESVCQIGGKEILSYALTELMPTADGKLNVEVLRLLLQEAGCEYVESIPALGDDLTSFGPYQFTQYAVFDTPDDTRGASIINQALPKSQKIPGSTMKLKGDDHHRAAWLFAVNNIADLVSAGYSLRKLKVLSKLDLIKFIAMAHHAPAYARKLQQEKKVASGWKERLENYAKKTGSNYNAL